MFFLAKLLAAWVSEFVADGAAARWGYGNGLADLLASEAPSEPAGLLERLTDEHPPTELRVERLRNALEG